MPVLLSLQYLRAIAAVAVVIFHNSGFGLGRAGVDLFFVLSGFLMVAITDDDTDPRRFFADRVRRVAPLYWLATTTMLMGVLAGLYPHVKIGAWHLFASYAFIPALAPSNGEFTPLLGLGWTLNYEMMFYAVFAVLMLLGSQWRQMIALTAIFAILVTIGFVFRPGSAVGFMFTRPIMFELAAGGWVGLAWKRTGDWPAWIGWPLIALALAAFACVHGVDEDRYRSIAFGIPALILLIGVLGLEKKMQVPRLNWLLSIGNASYSIYLAHPFAVSVAKRAGPKLGLPSSIWVTLGIIGGVIAGLIVHRWVEKPILAWFRERRTINRVVVPGGP